MNFFIENKEIDDIIRDIRKKIRLSMNGDISQSMEKMGIVYKKNFGVNIPRLKEIRSLYQPNHDLAQRLWALKIRETMILATMLQPIDKFTPELAGKWLTDINQPELAEQTTMNLFSKLPFAAELALDWINSPELWNQIVGYMLIARVWKSFSEIQISAIIEKAIQMANTGEMMLYKSIGLALSRIARKNKSTAEKILQQIDPFKNSDKASEKYIFSEISNEVSFLNF